MVIKVAFVVLLTLSANILFYGTVLGAAANFLWLLFKDVSLFPWIWLMWSSLSFVANIILVVVAYVSLKE